MERHSTIGDVAGEAVVDIASSATLRQAAEELAAEVVGALLVVRPSGAAGVLSERDIIRAIADGAEPDDERVGDWCTVELVRCTGDTPIADAVETMQAAQVRHMVVDLGEGETRIVSLRELVRHGGATVAA